MSAGLVAIALVGLRHVAIAHRGDGEKHVQPIEEGDAEMSFVKPAAVLITLVLTLPHLSVANAVTCEDVRSLSATEREYWSKRLNLTSEQRYQIWLACYGNSRRNAKNARLPAQ